jgi:AcrR family transcriptional regulator
MRNPNSDSGQGETRSGGRADATLERLLAGAQATFAERGYAASNIHEICARAKVGIGTFYAHFEHKRELLQQVLVERAPRLAADISADDLLDPARIAARLHKSVDDPMTSGLWRAWHEAVLEETELERFHSTLYVESAKHLADMVAGARSRVAPRADRADPALVAWTILTLARELGIHDRTNAPTVEQVAELIWRLVV